MPRLVNVTAQALVLAIFAAAIGYFSRLPQYTATAPGSALLTLSFSHAGAPVAKCRRLSQEELVALAPNMRKIEDCPRRRVPVYVELALDGQVVLAYSAPPSGLWDDGESHVYRKFMVPAGSHKLDVRMRDTVRDAGFDYQEILDMELAAGSVAVVDFDPNQDRFFLQ